VGRIGRGGGGGGGGGGRKNSEEIEKQRGALLDFVVRHPT
jgi:hypothetical protein